MNTKNTPLPGARAAAVAVGTAFLLLATATHAQLVVWSTTNYIDDPVGPYGTTTDFAGGANPTLNIVDPGMGGPGTHAMELTFNATSGTVLNFQSAGIYYPASGNTNAFLANYTLSFDMQVNGVNAGPFAQGFQISIFGPGGGVFGTGPKLELDLTTNVFTAGLGYQHYSFTLDKFTARNFDVTSNSFELGIGCVSYPANFTATPETFDFANVQITMITNPPPPPHPTMHIVPAKPALRVFGQNYAFTYNQEGFGTVDVFQSWVGATPSQPKSYSITFADFDTVDNYSLYAQFVTYSGSINPYVVYSGPDALVWRITHVTGGFTTGIDWKTNAPNSGTPNNALTLTTTSTNGRGTWTLTFTNDTDGTVTAPDGTSGSFSLPPEMAALFADPVDILFGTAPNDTGGYGQYIDISRIVITNVAGVNENDDFTKDDVLNTSLWDPAFSLDPGSVIQVSTNAPFWVTWTVPDPLYGLATKAGLNGGTNVWFSPNYYGSGVGATNTGPTQMGPSLKWTLIPKACLPTVDGTVGGPESPSGLFRLQNPPPSQ
jgi:hypothetical protein